MSFFHVKTRYNFCRVFKTSDTTSTASTSGSTQAPVESGQWSFDTAGFPSVYTLLIDTIYHSTVYRKLREPF